MSAGSKDSALNPDSEDLREVALAVFDAIFKDVDSVEVRGEFHPISLTSRSKLRSVNIDNLLFVEQNPKKDSKWAEMARGNHQIMWVFKGRRYIARVLDGKFLDLRRKPKK